jgi:uncharacterized membrane protein YkvA (DUF1232 family)
VGRIRSELSEREAVMAAKKSSTQRAPAKKAPAKKAAVSSRAVAKKPATAKKPAPAKPRSRGAKAQFAAQSKVFKKAQREARKVLKDPKEADKLASAAEEKAAKFSGPLKDVLGDLRALIRLIRAYSKGEYRDIPLMTVASAAAAVIYFVWPLDVIPDLVPVIGYSDDVVVAMFVVAAIHEDLAAFRRWEAEQTKAAKRKTPAAKKAKPKASAARPKRKAPAKGSTGRGRSKPRAS